MTPLSMLVNSSLVSSPSDPSLSPNETLIKWRPMTESAIGSWEDQTILPGGRLLSWLVSLRRREVTGFVVEGTDTSPLPLSLTHTHALSPAPACSSDTNSSSYLIYFLEDSSSRRLSSPSRSLSITGPGISISRNNTLSPSTIHRYLPGVSDKKLYLMTSGLVH
jgi:hypothetical protein